MSDSINAPRWALEEYDDAAKDFADWLYEVLYAATAKDVPDQESAYRLMAQVRARAMERTDELHGLMVRSQAYQMWQANKQGWYHFLPGEYDTLREYMHSIADAETGDSSTKYDLLFMADTLLPALENMGVDAVKVISMPDKFSKARAAVPYFRAALDNLTGEPLAAAVKELLDGIADDSIGVRAFRDGLAKKAGKSIGDVWGDVYIFPEYNMLVIRAKDERFQRFIESKTKGVVQFRGPKDPIELLKEINDILTGEEDDDQTDD